MKGLGMIGAGFGLLACLAMAPAPVLAQDAETVARVSVSRSWALPLFQQWSIRPYAAAHMAASEGRAFVGTREGRLFAVDGESGAIHWVRDLGDRISGGPAVDGQGRVYVGTDQGQVFALSADSGETAWQGEVSSEVITAPRVAGGMVFVRTADDFLWALRSADGGDRWSFNVEGRSLALRGGSRPAFRDGRVYAGFSSGELVALNAGDGSPRWREAVANPSGRTELERMVDVDAAPEVLDGMVVAAAYQGAVVALDTANGQQLWKRNFSVYNDPAVAGERVFVTTADQTVIALDRNNGGTLWTQKVLAGSGALSSPVVTDEAVVVGDGEGRITWFHRDSGKLTGQIDLGPSAVHGPPLVLADGSVLALSDQGTLHRVEGP